MGVYTNGRQLSQSVTEEGSHLHNTVHRSSHPQLDMCCTGRDVIENNISLADINVIMQKKERLQKIKSNGIQLILCRK